MKPLSKFKALSIQARLVIALFGVVALFAAVWGGMRSGQVPEAGRLAFLVILGAATAHARVKLSKTSSLSLLTSVVMLSLMVDGVLAAVVVGVTGVTVQAFLPSRKFVVHRFVFNTAMVVLAIQAASVPYYWVISQNLAATLVSHVLGIAAASLTYYLGNSISMSLIVALTECKSIFRVWYDHFLAAAPSFVTSGLLSLVALESVTTTLLWAALLLPLLYVSYRSLRMARAFAVS
jgi:hypothetical protein